ncbi:hypothetical protein FA95DRAFT_690148 [Auriscalpium vulgare]|uniref:Uncharacterized protein n=1 Tax=Auriscalpium vulgare TaxID=40419 RepID=A0ACB8RBN4_9AGAM|nr:hypothetical protein FA95DRAFT_690148 [Auriscalpium vulgare]
MAIEPSSPPYALAQIELTDRLVHRRACSRRLELRRHVHTNGARQFFPAGELWADRQRKGEYMLRLRLAAADMVEDGQRMFICARDRCHDMRAGGSGVLVLGLLACVPDRAGGSRIAEQRCAALTRLGSSAGVLLAGQINIRRVQAWVDPARLPHGGVCRLADPLPGLRCSLQEIQFAA